MATAVANLALDTRFHEHIRMPFMSQMVDAEADDSSNGTAEFDPGDQLQAATAGHPAGVDAEFFPDGRWRSILVVNIGHPGDDAFRDRMPRLDETDIIHQPVSKGFGRPAGSDR